MVIWKYQCYISNDAPNLWAVWYSSQSHEVRAKHDTAFEFLEDRNEWGDPHYKRLVDQGGLGEVRLKGKVAWRIFGFRRTNKANGEKEFVVTHVGYHKGNSYTPRQVIKQAHKRMKEIESDASKAKSCSRPK